MFLLKKNLIDQTNNGQQAVNKGLWLFAYFATLRLGLEAVNYYMERKRLQG